MVEVKQGAHAGYYPGNTPTFKYIMTKLHVLLRAAVGQEGVDKRIDVLSIAMMNK